MQKSSKPAESSNEKVTKKKTVSKKVTKDLFDINVTAKTLSKKETKKPTWGVESVCSPLRHQAAVGYMSISSFAQQLHFFIVSS
jgi:hypothetical protein